MIANAAELHHLIAEMAVLIEQNADPDPQLYTFFFQHPELSFQLVDLIDRLDERLIDDGPPIYSACIFALEICVAQLQAAIEADNKTATKTLDQLMSHMAETLNSNKHGISFWLPVLNAFYEVHVELSASLKDAYFELARQESDAFDEDDDPSTHLDSIKDLILELSDLSIFDIAEHFFVQSYAMPPEFFVELIVDLYHIEEGREIALLVLLHPDAEIREVAVTTLDQLMDKMLLTSTSLSRLQTIKYWYPSRYYPVFDRWIKCQRKKGVVFDPEPVLAKMSFKATEIDGSGAQGLFIHVREKRKNWVCGLLLKYGLGLKDAWLTPEISTQEVVNYQQRAFDENVPLRKIDMDYFQLIVEHFLALTIEQDDVPSVHFLEIQKLTGIRLRPNKLDVEHLFDQLSIQIAPFTQETIQETLQRTKSWLKNKRFTESWYLESSVIDKIVNHNSSFVEGVKVCRLEEAVAAIFAEEMEQNREKWQFHFLWVALWAKANAKKNEKIWQDSFLIAYAIHAGTPLKEIPVMQEICRQTVINSAETMRERRTHLSRE